MSRVALALVCALFAACAVEREPTVEVVDLDELDAALAKQRGSGVLLNFWAMWCAPCVAELPELMEVEREFADEGGRVLLLSYDLIVPGANRSGIEERVHEFAAQRGFDVPIYVYDAPDYEAINERFDLPGGVPVTLAIDASGKIVDTQDGPAGKARFAEMMKRALGRE